MTLTIRTVPPAPGIHLLFDGQSLRTNAQGLASITIEHDLVNHSLSLTDVTRNTPTSRMTFTRWSGQRDPEQVHSPKVVGLPMRANYTIVAAFSVKYPVSVRLTQQNGNPLGRTDISAITARSDAGQLVPLSLTTATWLQGVRPVLVNAALTSQQVSYSIQSVIVDGSNVVDAGKQTFKPTAAMTARVQTSFFDLTVASHDAMFGSVNPKSATLTYPDGTEKVLPFRQGSLTVTGLPRGHYKVKLHAGSGLAATADFNLSRDQTENIAVISLHDVVLVLSALLLLAILLIGLGRAHWLSRMRRGRSSEPAQDPEYIEDEHARRIPA